MLILNGKKFAATEKEFTNSLFNSGGTCVGFYKLYKSSVVLMNHKKERIGVINRHGVLCHARKVNGGFWYSHMDIPEIGEYKSYMQQCDECRDALKMAAN